MLNFIKNTALALLLTIVGTAAMADTFQVPAGAEFQVVCNDEVRDIRWKMEGPASRCPILLSAADLAQLGQMDVTKRIRTVTPVFKTTDGRVWLVPVELTPNRAPLVMPWQKRMTVCGMNRNAPNTPVLLARGWDLDALRRMSGCDN